MISICTIRPVFKVTTMHTLRLVSITHPKSLLAARSLIYSTPKYASYAPDLPSRCDRGTSDSPRYRLLLRTCFYIKCLSVPCYWNDIVMTFMRFVGDSWIEGSFDEGRRHRKPRTSYALRWSPATNLMLLLSEPYDSSGSDDNWGSNIHIEITKARAIVYFLGSVTADTRCSRALIEIVKFKFKYIFAFHSVAIYSPPNIAFRPFPNSKFEFEFIWILNSNLNLIQ